MRKNGLIALFAIMAIFVLCFALFTACNSNKEFTIQYTDDSGTHQISVTSGMPYSLEDIPTKSGYIFTGLFDAEVGGKQYVSATGASLAPFTDGKNIVLFPQFKAKEYTFILDYQGAQVTGARQIVVEYGASLPNLPNDLTGEHKTFCGWYTSSDCQGKQVADVYGLLPLVSVVNDNNFDLSGDSVYLYAGFEIEKFTVTCIFGDGIAPEYLQIDYDTPVSQIVPATRIDGQAPLTWSTTQGGEVFNGKITSDTALYALEYAPVIELDSNGGDKVVSVVARPGSIITLPTPTKDMAKFAYWEDMQGNEYTSTRMPSNSIFLKAVWKAKLVFDSNGGSEVDEISFLAGENITLPIPEKEGYIFAGWYTAEKDQYTSTVMPSIGIKLKAGWYKAKSESIIVTNDNRNNLNNCAYSSEKFSKAFTDGPSAEWRKTVDLSQYLAKSGGRIKITLHIDMRNRNSASIFQGGIYVYDGAEVSDANYLTKCIHKITKNTWETFTDCEVLDMRSDTLYLCYYASTSAGSGDWDCLFFTNMWLDLEYPDTSNLYL